MSFEVKIILDSIAPNGKRLTTLTATYPRFIHSEVMTHRAFERNAASSRAIPWSKMRKQILENPVVPLVFGSEQKGMQTGGEVDDVESCRFLWLKARDEALDRADALHRQGVHKSLVNRVVEPYMWITTIITATEWNNFFRQRCHPDAEIHFQKIAWLIRNARDASTPQRLEENEWHLPFITGEDWSEAFRYQDSEKGILTIDRLCQISTARVARISYLTHEGYRSIPKDLELFEKLVGGSGFGHWSPHGHIAQAIPCRVITGSGMVNGSEYRSGPFFGWEQFRKSFPMENVAG